LDEPSLGQKVKVNEKEVRGLKKARKGKCKGIKG
jgi:hypothetical protein